VVFEMREESCGDGGIAEIVALLFQLQKLCT
jgi:hypothetical protein